MLANLTTLTIFMEIDIMSYPSGADDFEEFNAGILALKN